MAHNFVKQADGSKVCSWCGDEKNVDMERDCPRSGKGIRTNYALATPSAPTPQGEKL